MNLDDWLSQLERRHFKSIDMGLDRIKPVAERLGVLSQHPFIISVAGTNGKGSTIAVMEALLAQSDYRVGVYTSPHLVNFNERVRINQQDCNDDQLVAAFEAVETARQDVSLTYFEFTTLAALYLFQQRDLDVWLLEVGLGGRLDAVNICDPDIAIVTSIDLDHQQWLGDTRAKIGIEKIGIGRKGKPLIVGEPDLPEEVRQAIREQGSQHLQVGQDFSYQLSAGEVEIVLNGKADLSLHPLRCRQRNLLPVNIASALQALALSPFKVDFKQLDAALDTISIIGRQQWLEGEIPTVLDVGHNPHSARELCRALQQKLNGYTEAEKPELLCVVGMLADKAITETLMELLPVADKWYAVNLKAARSASAAEIAEQLQLMGARVSGVGSSPALVYQRLSGELTSNHHKKSIILVFGSFYTVADVIQYCPQLRV